jgi:hypothetical protein
VAFPVGEGKAADGAFSVRPLLWGATLSFPAVSVERVAHAENMKTLKHKNTATIVAVFGRLILIIFFLRPSLILQQEEMTLPVTTNESTCLYNICSTFGWFSYHIFYSPPTFIFPNIPGISPK